MATGIVTLPLIIVPAIMWLIDPVKIPSTPQAPSTETGGLGGLGSILKDAHSVVYGTVIGTVIIFNGIPFIAV